MARKFKSMDGNNAAAYVSYAFTEVAGIYPITPSSTMAEYVDEWASAGKKNFWGEKVKVVESAVEDGEITVDIPEEGKIVLVIKDGKIAEFKEYMDEKPEETPETETKTPDEFSQRLTALESSLSEIKTMLSKQTKTPPVATRTVGGKPKTDAQKTQLSNEEARKKAREAMVKFAKEK